MRSVAVAFGAVSRLACTCAPALADRWVPPRSALL
jgi:hypothetical protein